MLYLLLSIIFILGYLGIIFERFIRINKAAVALLMGGALWIIIFIYSNDGKNLNQFAFLEEMTGIAQIIFFLIAAMAIVELVDSHHGFKLVTDIIYSTSKRRMLWYILLISFFMSAVLDNLTSMIVMISLIRKLTHNGNDRLIYGSMVVIAVNAGGAWTPIGDVTTTMLWIGGAITTWPTMKSLFLPSLVCMVVSGAFGTFLLKGKNEGRSHLTHHPLQPGAKVVFICGILSLIMVPVWKGLFGIPPFMGALIGLGLLWLITDLIHHKHGEKRTHLRVPHVLSRIDTSGVLFFLGILLAVNALTISGLLKDTATQIEVAIPNQNYVAIVIGLISSIVDNVPLVAATLGMYNIEHYPVDSTLWQLIAYAAGTGGSILIIGSAAGVAFMGIEKVDFLWYLKRISWIALIGYFAGIGVYFLFNI